MSAIHPGKAPPSKWIRLSIVAAIVTIALKGLGAHLTHSVGLLSDALESLVNLAAALIATFALRWSEAPPDRAHPFGHGKGELLAALLEGALVCIAGVAIIGAAIERLMHPKPVEQTGIGLALCAVAAVVNAAVGQALIRVGKRERSSALRADGKHLMSDVWTSVAVVAGVALASWTKVAWLDALCALGVALLVLHSGANIVRESVASLLDTKLSAEDEAAIDEALGPFRARGVAFDLVRTRQGGRSRFVHVTMRVPGTWSVREAHDIADEVERSIEKSLHDARIETHVEPLE